MGGVQLLYIACPKNHFASCGLNVDPEKANCRFVEYDGAIAIEILPGKVVEEGEYLYLASYTQEPNVIFLPAFVWDGQGINVVLPKAASRSGR
jgi:hypothetical protein